jgi:hypothetical protein
MLIKIILPIKVIYINIKIIFNKSSEKNMHD